MAAAAAAAARQQHHKHKRMHIDRHPRAVLHLKSSSCACDIDTLTLPSGGVMGGDLDG
jgi:hypothetical protein